MASHHTLYKTFILLLSYLFIFFNKLVANFQIVIYNNDSAGGKKFTLRLLFLRLAKACMYFMNLTIILHVKSISVFYKSTFTAQF